MEICYLETDLVKILMTVVVAPKACARVVG